MIFCALCEQPATAVQVLPGGRARPVCVLHDVPASVRNAAKRPADKNKAAERDTPKEPPALAAE